MGTEGTDARVDTPDLLIDVEPFENNRMIAGTPDLCVGDTACRVNRPADEGDGVSGRTTGPL
jgi:hypothetical protein